MHTHLGAGVVKLSRLPNGQSPGAQDEDLPRPLRDRVDLPRQRFVAQL